MSKKHPKRRGRATPPASQSIRPILIVATCLVIGAALVVILLASRPVSSGGTPRIAVAQDTVDHGNVRFEVPVQSVFKVRNTGDGDLVILGEPRVELVEGC